MIKINIYTIDKIDLEKYVNFLNRVFSKNFNTKFNTNFIKWKYDSPFGKSKIAIASIEDNIIGTNTITPFILHTPFGKTKIWQAGDSATDTLYRNQKVSFKLLSVLRDSISDTEIMFGFPNKQAIGAVNRSGFPVRQVVPQYLKVNSFYNITHDYELREVKSINEIPYIFDLKINLPYYKKNPDYMIWRYFKKPETDYKMWKVMEDDNCILFAVSREIKLKGIKFVVLMELFTYDSKSINFLTYNLCKYYNSWFTYLNSNLIKYCLSDAHKYFYRIPNFLLPKVQYLTANGKSDVCKKICNLEWIIQGGDWDAL